jgi:hypothetical protein
MQKIEDYRAHSDECRSMANRARSPEVGAVTLPGLGLRTAQEDRSRAVGLKDLRDAPSRANDRAAASPRELTASWRSR